MLTIPTFPSNPALVPQFPPRRMRPVCAAAVSEASPVSAPAAGTRSLYEVLRTRRNASRTEIKTAYRTLAKLYHPDAASPAAGGRDFIEIRNAYATLSDPEARAAYDFSLEVSSQRRRRTAGFPGSFNPTRRWETDQCW